MAIRSYVKSAPRSGSDQLLGCTAFTEDAYDDEWYVEHEPADKEFAALAALTEHRIDALGLAVEVERPASEDWDVVSQAESSWTLLDEPEEAVARAISVAAAAQPRLPRSRSILARSCPRR